MPITSAPIDERALVAQSKPELIIHETEELNAETPAHLLDDEITPLHRLFVRNSGLMPAIGVNQLAAWTLAIDGCVETPRAWTLAALRREFEPVMQVAVIECAGNGRAFFAQPTSTQLWRRGAVGCVRWTGVRLAELLRRCGLLPAAVYTGHHSPDLALDGSGPALSRGLPIAKALAPETLVAYAINGEPIPPLHGGPLRVVAPGYPSSAWQKWLTRITVRDREHDGARMDWIWYRMPRTPVRYGEPFDLSQFDVLTDMPVRSVITFPQDGFRAPPGRPLCVRGHAWSGHIPVASVEVSFDGAQTWQQASLGPLPDRFAWRRFEALLASPPAGAIEMVARACDAEGNLQPLESVPWNPRGYCNNLVHRVHGTLA